MGSNSQQELLCLRWEDFGSHFSSSFRDLRNQNSRDSYFDVSLAVADEDAGGGSDTVLQAHRVILSTCSPFFRSVLAKQSRSSPLSGLVQPVIYLRGVTARDLRNVLDFMYNGEVNVAQDDLDAFLAVAQDLKIKGLTQQGDHDDEEVKPPKFDHQRGMKRQAPAAADSGTAAAAAKKRPVQSHSRQLPKAGRHHHPAAASAAQAGDDDIEDVTPIKSETPSSATAPVAGSSSSMVVMEGDDGSGSHVGGGAGEAGGYEEGDYGEEDYGDYGEESYAEDDGSNQMAAAAGGGGGEAGGGGGGGGKGLFYQPGELEVYRRAQVVASSASGDWLCRLCQKVLRATSNVKYHFQSRHMVKKVVYRCPERGCDGREWYTARNFSNHVYRLHPRLKGMDFDEFASPLLQ